jgi:hypothetical protein
MIDWNFLYNDQKKGSRKKAINILLHHLWGLSGQNSKLFPSNHINELLHLSKILWSQSLHG